MGFGILFRVDDESAQRHERKDWPRHPSVEMESTVSWGASRYGLEELEEAVLPPALPPPKEERDGGERSRAGAAGAGAEPVFESLAGQRGRGRGVSLSVQLPTLAATTRP